MKRLTTKIAFATIAALTAFVCAGPSLAQETPPAVVAAQVREADPALWRLSDDDTTIFLFGTFHLLDANADWFTEEVRSAFDASDELVLEAMVLEDVDAMRTLTVRYGVDTTGTPLSDKVPTETMIKLRQMLAELGLPEDAFDQLDPWLAATSAASLVMQRMGMEGQTGADEVLAAAAREAGKPLDELEGLEYQLRMIDDLPASLQAEWLTLQMEEAEDFPETIAAMRQAWRKGEIETLAELMQEGELGIPGIYQLLVADRNARWTDWVVERMDEPGTVFLAVGAGHLTGPDNLRQLLGERGMQAVRLDD